MKFHKILIEYTDYLGHSILLARMPALALARKSAALKLTSALPSALWLALAFALALTACAGSGDDTPTAPVATGTGQPDPDPDPDVTMREGFTFLAKGARSAIFTLPVPGVDEALALSYEQECTTASTAGCCNMLVYADNPPAIRSLSLTGLFDLIVNPGATVLGNVYDHSDVRSLKAIYFADSACSITEPETQILPTAETIVQVSLSGQIQVHRQVRLQAFGQRHYLRDISRRRSLNTFGGMTDDAYIGVEVLHDYASSLPFVLANPDSYFRTTSVATFTDTQARSATVRRAADALVYTQATYDFFLEEFALNSRANDGASMIAVVDTPFPTRDIVSVCEPGEVLKRGSSFNAFYVSGTPFIFFTPIPKALADQGLDRTFSASLEVVAHEWAHAYMDEFSDLNYERESGALSEAIADWTAVRISFEHGDGSWQFGDDFFPSNDGRVLRDLTIPRAVGDALWVETDRASCPEVALCNDNCGVHSNNAIPNYMFHLLAAGGAVPQRGQAAAFTLRGIGIDKAFKVAFEANKTYWTSNTNFAGARTGMEMAARALFPGDPAIERHVSVAWSAVGVGNAPTPFSATPAPTPAQ
ncbi:MAG: M4 family metallopeptidase [Gammaproteobacteria bacterium]|nr:M4 family metallopeptidase [Gammaproteobacteria bacterium]